VARIKPSSAWPTSWRGVAPGRARKRRAEESFISPIDDIGGSGLFQLLDISWERRASDWPLGVGTFFCRTSELPLSASPAVFPAARAVATGPGFFSSYG